MGVLYDLAARMGHAQSAVARIDELNEQAFKIRVSDSILALEVSKEIVELAREAGYTKGLAYGLRTLGFCQMRLSKNEEALIYLNEAMSLFESLGDIHGQGYVYETYGIIQRNFGDYQRSLEFLYQGLELMRQVESHEGETLSLYHIGVTYKYMGNLEKALECFLQSLSIAKTYNNQIGESYSLNTIGGIYSELGDNNQALEYFHQSLVIRKAMGDKWGEAGCLDNIGYTHFKLGNYDQGLESCQNSLTIAQASGDKKGQANSLFHLAEIHQLKGNYTEANTYANQSLGIRSDINDKKGQAEVYLSLADILNPADHSQGSEGQLDYLHKALSLGEETKALDLLYKIHHAFYKVYKERKQYDQALAHLELFNTIEKEIHSNSINQKIQSLEIDNRMEQSKKENEIYRLKNIELAALNEATTRQKEEIERTLIQLKSTQAQLIQSEKMASLGELTAGIAHEIQNPLNFVNNFSEVNTELIKEIQDERRKTQNKRDDKLEDELLQDIVQNQEKINHHGKRAADIVKSMLQHSRSSSGLKEPTDISALADEYLRLAYHGLRAKDKSFNTTLKTDFDESIGNINVIPQDIGRVILNLITNAFYTVSEKATLRQDQGDSQYEPTVSVSTHHSLSSGEGRGEVLIKVNDNGNGIPQKVLDKIFQPFFTTKPTGQGTGLGLSLSYDIVKAHGGELKVETKEGEGSEFVIQLPLG
jgi:two-component system, NtrC family, sensor kinase